MSTVKPPRARSPLTLPDGRRVTCWRKDAHAIYADVALTGNVFLNRPLGSEVYERVDPVSVEAVELMPQAR